MYLASFAGKTPFAGNQMDAHVPPNVSLFPNTPPKFYPPLPPPTSAPQESDVNYGWPQLSSVANHYRFMQEREASFIEYASRGPASYPQPASYPDMMQDAYYSPMTSAICPNVSLPPSDNMSGAFVLPSDTNYYPQTPKYA